MTTVEILFLILGFVAGVVLCAVLFIVAAVKHGRATPIEPVLLDSNNARWTPDQLAILADAVRDAAAEDARDRRDRG